MTLAGIRRFHAFGKCPSKNRLGVYLGEWESLRKKYGGHMPDWNLYGMLINMLPDDVAQDVRRLSHLNDTQRVLDYLHGELARYNDTHLSEITPRGTRLPSTLAPRTQSTLCLRIE